MTVLENSGGGPAQRAPGHSVAPPRTATEPRDLLKWFDLVWTAVAMGALLMVFQLGSTAALTIVLALPVYAFVRYRRLPRLLLSILPILLLPTFAMMSTLWSVAPGLTLYYGFQYLLTVAIGATIGAGIDRRQALFGLFLAFAGYAVISLLFGQEVGWGGGGASGITTAFSGISGSKNTAADSAAIGLLISLAIVVAMLRERTWPIAALAATIVAIDGWILRNAESTGALVACGLASIAMLGWSVARLLAASTRTAIFIIIGVAVGLAAALQSLWLQPLIAATLLATGKDPTLTGRTYIWDRGYRLIEARPMLGLGYNAFWRHGNIEAEGLWQFAGITSRTGFNFHNTFIEIMVHLGIVGLALYAVVIVSLFVIQIIRTMRSPTDISVLFCTYLSYVAVRVSIETQAFGPFAYSTAMIMAGLACAVWRPEITGSFALETPRAVLRWRGDQPATTG
ncbi:O-antigen ligase family protein [Sphingomonas koreensis]|nr:O-antigen ligase family protein [Sphingomonas koreensis]